MQVVDDEGYFDQGQGQDNRVDNQAEPDIMEIVDRVYQCGIGQEESLDDQQDGAVAHHVFLDDDIERGRDEDGFIYVDHEEIDEQVREAPGDLLERGQDQIASDDHQ